MREENPQAMGNTSNKLDSTKSQTNIEEDEEDSKRRHAKLESKRRFECTFPGCGRHYSRAEHLYRHQLNHNPKEIFKCNYPGCTRVFVRQDLCIRHQDRHTNRDRQDSVNGTASEKLRDQQLSHAEIIAQTRRSSASSVPEAIRSDTLSTTYRRSEFPVSSSNSFNSPLILRKTENVNATSPEKPIDWFQMPSPSGQAQVQQSSKSFYSPQDSSRVVQETSDTSFQTFDPSSPNTQRSLSYTQAARPSLSHSIDQNAHNLLASSSHPINHISAGNSRQYSTHSTAGTSTDNSLGQFAVPNMGEQRFEESPSSIRDEFTSWLFDEYSLMQTGTFPLTTQPMGHVSASGNFGTQINANYFGDSPLHPFPDIMIQSPIEARDQGLSATTDGGLVSEMKRRSLLSLMEFRFAQADNSTVQNLREEVFRGNRDADEHVLSLRSMQLYVSSYWQHFHAQLPILHQPTFSPDKVHENLLLAVMAVGASSLDQINGKNFTNSASRFATFIAWHLRWQVFMNSDFRPPAKLWVFQTLILLEFYETFCATRGLHERAHIHYATTITLMRRGTALIDDSIQTQSQADRAPTTPDQWWNRWITSEATRRVALAAFFLDAVHACLFNHRATMVVHEVRLPLPCDDALWSATSAEEVARVEASLHANGIKQTTFLDGLKKTLTGRKARTNVFGRMILMAGLLSVSWHMNQRDLQISSLGVSTSMGVPDGWKEPLSKAFEFWYKDFDESVSHMQSAILPWQRLDSDMCSQTIRRIALVLYHLSFMSIHVDVLECQMFTGAPRLVGRAITDQEHERVKASMQTWAKSSGARIAVYHAIHLLKSVLITKYNGEINLYNAREDHIILQSWIVYYSTLIIWSYGFAIDGVLRPFPTHLLPSSRQSNASMNISAYEQQLYADQQARDLERDALIRNAQSYLQTIGTISNPQELETIKSGRNNVVGLLRLVELSFSDSRWDLSHEAADRLKHAIRLLEG